MLDFLPQENMCIKQGVEYFSLTESENDLNEDSHLEWPLNLPNNSKLIIACSICFYPITYEQNILEEIRNENNISFGYIVPIRKLFKKIKIYNENLSDQWETIVCCPDCGVILSFTSPQNNNLTINNFEKITLHKNLDDQIVILWSYLLFRGSSEEAKSRFIQINEN